jgi:DNA polymerase-3 subunit delta
MDSLAFLERAAKSEPRTVYVLHGDEDFLRRQVLAALRELVLGKEADAFGLSTHAGDTADFSVVRGELETLPFLSPRRLVVIESADKFVTRYRAALERYVGQPATTGVLVLEVRSWPSNTKLYKQLGPDAAIVCQPLKPQQLPPWCVRRAEAEHGKQLAAPAARLLVDLIGPDMGQLDQELAKLAVYVGEANRIDSEDVDKLVGQSRAEDMWKIFEAMGGGQTADALAIIDRLFDQGQDALAILGAFSWQLRKLAQAHRLNQQGRPLAVALGEAGFPPYRIRDAEMQLKHLGGRRAERLYEWLLETDLGLKGSSLLPPKTQMERFVVLLARTDSGARAPE